MMKARSFDRRFLTRGIYPNIFSIQESNSINTDYYTLFGELQPIAQKLTAEFVDAKIYGSILNLKTTAEEITQLDIRYNEIVEAVYDNFFDSARQSGLRTLFAPLINQAKIMIQKYDIICTNPPYLNSSYMPDKLKNYVISNYKDYKSDLFAVFIYKTTQTLNKDGYLGILTPYVWMFISSYENLRENIIKNTNISTLVQLEYNAFEAACVPVCAFVINKTTQNRFGEYIKLSDFKGIENQEPKTLEAINNKNCGYRFTANADNFSKIPGSPIAYWVSERCFQLFESKRIIDYSKKVCKGVFTADNNAYLRLWYEISNIALFNDTWHKYSKGGTFRRWYGNSDRVIYWTNNGKLLKSDRRAGMGASKYFGEKHIVWSGITSYKASFRADDSDVFFDDVSPSIVFEDNTKLYNYLLALCNSKITELILWILNPTMHYQAGDVKQLPVILTEKSSIFKNLDKIVENNIIISKEDCDSFETSSDFKKHPLI